MLFVFAAYGNEAGQTSGGVGNGDSPELGNLTAYPYVVDSPSTTTTVTSSVNPQTTGNNVTFTATVVPIPLGVTGPTGTVSFFDGTTLLGTGTLNLVSGSYIATYMTSSACPWHSHHQSDLPRQCGLFGIKRNVDPDDRSPAEPYCR